MHALRTFATLLGSLADELGGAWRLALARREFDAVVDAATLRDLGMSRSEHGSYWAESEARVEPTRLRVLLRLRAHGGPR